MLKIFDSDKEVGLVNYEIYNSVNKQKLKMLIKRGNSFKINSFSVVLRKNININ